MASDPRNTPAMQQYYRFKKRHPDCVLLFRIGDFYEMFDDDAVAVSKAIGLTLTQRTEGVPMAGLPFHQLEGYLRKLINAGFRVAVCEQLEDAAQAKGIVQRGVTRVLTPGTLVDENLLDAEAVRTLGAIVFTGSGEESPASVAIADVPTGSFVVADCSAATIVDELSRRGVRELLFAATADGKTPPRIQRLIDALGIASTPRPVWHYRIEEAREAVLKLYKVSTLAGFGLRDDDPAIPAAGALIRYLLETQTPNDDAPDTRTTASLKHLRPPRREDASPQCVVDAVSLRSLEIERTIRAGASGAFATGGKGDASLLGIFLGGAGGKSCCRTGMGKRILRDWLVRPSGDLRTIEGRHDAVAALFADRTMSEAIGNALERVQDVARIGGRIALGRATPRDLVGLARSLDQLDSLVEAMKQSPALAALRNRLESQRHRLEPVVASVLKSCVDEPPPHLREGGVFRDGVDPDLDEARMLQRDAGTWLAEYQARLIAAHDLPSLKVGFNKIFGYYIELPAAQARKAPAELVRKQTLRSAERFTTPELREFEGKVMSAESRALDREREMFATLCGVAAAVLDGIGVFSDAVAEVDALLAFAEKAARRGWNRPVMCEAPVLQIHAGRHPVLDEMLGSGFVPNDIELGDSRHFAYASGALAEAGDAADPTSPTASTSTSDADTRAPAASAETAHLALITGPNMAGKSTFIRQTALICLLAHAGSFVPADRATIGLTDRIFTRIGADDALHAGQSTFMVEMIETANILNHVGGRSLVVLDEIGRGTSTLDGLSLAWGIAEHLAGDGGTHGDPRPRTLFATHYHELTDLEERLPGRVKNLHVAVREWPPGDPQAEIIFLHRILAGRTDQSYGLHVARLAGIPASVVGRAREVLASLAVHHALGGETGQPDYSKTRADPAVVPPRSRDGGNGQLALFTEYLQHPAVDALRELKLETLTPIDAFDHLRRLKLLLGKK